MISYKHYKTSPACKEENLTELFANILKKDKFIPLIAAARLLKEAQRRLSIGDDNLSSFIFDLMETYEKDDRQRVS